MNGKKIREKMDEKKYTFRSLGERLGVSYVTVWSWANNKTEVSNVQLLKKLCEALGCEMEELL